MMTDLTPNAPVPPDKLIEQWRDDYVHLAYSPDVPAGDYYPYQAKRAAAWGYAKAIPEREELESAYADAISALHYIEQMYGRLYGVGWDRLYAAAERLRGGGSDG